MRPDTLCERAPAERPGPLRISGLTRWLLMAAGSLSVGLGVLGVFLPVLPTTPFLLLAAVCFSRSSERLHRWLLGNRWFGPYVRNYVEGRGLPRRVKIVTLVLLWLSLGYAALVVTGNVWVRVLFAGVAAGVTWHVVRLKTLASQAGQEACGEG